MIDLQLLQRVRESRAFAPDSVRHDDCSFHRLADDVSSSAFDGDLMSEERFDQIEQRLDKLDRDVSELKSGHESLSRQMMDAKDSLSREMRVLHEDLKADIKALSLPVPELERRWRADDALVVEKIGQRLDPLEASARKHFGTE